MLALAYDLLLYLWRFATYGLPYVGGRARGRNRPRAPSLTERPNGHRRQISFAGIPRLGTDSTEAASTTAVHQTSMKSQPGAVNDIVQEDTNR